MLQIVLATSAISLGLLALLLTLVDLVNTIRAKTSLSSWLRSDTAARSAVRDALKRNDLAAARGVLEQKLATLSKSVRREAESALDESSKRARARYMADLAGRDA
jgi:biopolymer transport protein ExbB/TolQ